MKVSSSQARINFSALPDQVERGEEVIITRRGRSVAKLVPVPRPADVSKAREALRRIRKRAKEMNFGPFNWEEWKRYRDEGRR